MKKLYTLLFLLCNCFFVHSQVVISQIYGAGGNSGAIFTNDYVELFNLTSSPVDLSGWTLNYASATGSFGTNNRNTLPAGTTINANSYLLIQLAGGANGDPLPVTADVIVATSPINLAAANGKLALTNDNEALSGTDPSGAANLIDFVGFGTANGFEGAGAAPAPSTVNAIYRLNNGCTDTNNNNADFIAAAASPRSSASPINACTNDPSLFIASPANNTIFNPETTTVNISLIILNFVVGTPGAGIDGHIHYSVNGGSIVMQYDTDPIVLNGLTPGSYSVVVELVNNSHQPLNPAVTSTVNFTIASYINVNNISELRQDVIANGVGRYYQINSQPVVTYARATRNQKYIQDATAAILIDDNDGIIPNSYNIGDVMSGVKGRTSLFSGLLQLIPTTNASLASTGNDLTPQVVSLSDLIDNLESYESELVQINNVTFADGDGTNVFVSPPNTNYAFTNGTETVNFRTLFTEANYIGSLIPVGPTSFAALVGNFNGAPQVTARSSNDLTLSIRNNSIEGLKIYPNPVLDGILYISTPANAEKSIAVYDVLGKQVLTTTTSNEAVNVSGLMKGIYMVRITENSKTATLKLVIR